nr:ORF6N domain-containing protein [Acinetobacter soli]
MEGKHFFKIVGQELKDFVSSLKILTNFPTISNKTRSLILWTERGAARHAKILDTDQAWDVFEQLEDCYFHRQEMLAKTHKSERTPLHDAHALLVAKTKHLNSSDAWKIINQRFGTNHIEEIPYDQIPVAVEYVHHLIALYSNADKKAANQSDHLQLIKDLVNAALLQNCMTSCLYRAAHAFNNREGMSMANYAFKTNIAILRLTRAMDLRGPQNRKIISDDLKTASYTEGNQHYGSVWFHPLSDSGKLAGALRISGGW